MTKKMTPDVHVTFGRNLKQRREELALSQAALAEKVGCSRHNISNIERGNQGVAIALFVAICGALKCEPNAMLRGAR